MHTERDGSFVTLVRILCAASRLPFPSTADERLDQRRTAGEDEGIDKGLKISVLCPDFLIYPYIPMLRDQHDRGVSKIVEAHEGSHKHREEGRKDYVCNTNQKDETKNIPHNLLQKEQAEKL